MNPDSNDRSYSPKRGWRFGDWYLHVGSRCLSHDGNANRLDPKLFDLLVYLVERPNQIVGRSELMKAVWPDVIVCQDTLNQSISRLRKALDDNSRRPRYIETIPKVGYRFCSPVESISDPAKVSLMARGAWKWVAIFALLVVTVLWSNWGHLPSPGKDPDSRIIHSIDLEKEPPGTVIFLTKEGGLSRSDPSVEPGRFNAPSVNQDKR